jgi:nitroreductase
MDISTVDKLLTTTRAVKKRLDLKRQVERDVIEKCLEIATQAPVGGNIPKYHFVVITDIEKKIEIAELYRKSLYETYLPHRDPEDLTFPEREELWMRSTLHLADHLQEVPVLVIPCIEGRWKDPSPWYQASMYAQIIPAVWSMMLALRARGLGSSWTTLHLVYEKEVAELLGIPTDITQVALIPVAYFTGQDFRPANRIPARERTYWNGWKTN